MRYKFKKHKFPFWKGFREWFRMVEKSDGEEDDGLVESMRSALSLRKAGKNYIMLCPFHKEKTPSCTVSPRFKIFYCFGCGETGNFDKLMEKFLENKNQTEYI